MFVANDTPTVKLYKLTKEEDITKLVEEKEILRGTEVIDTKKQVTYEEKVYNNIIVDNKKYYINIENLTKTKDLIVKEEYIYTRSTTTILENKDDIKIAGLSKKGVKLEVLG